MRLPLAGLVVVRRAYSRHSRPRRRLGNRARPLLLSMIVSVILTAATGCAAAAGGGSSGARPGGTFSAAEQSRLTAAVARAVAADVAAVQTSFRDERTVQVTATVEWTDQIGLGDVEREQERVKAICFGVQKALWTSEVAMADALVIVMGPVVDEYGEQTTDAHGTAELGAPTAAGLGWGALDADAAWARYDHVFLRSTFTFEA